MEAAILLGAARAWTLQWLDVFDQVTPSKILFDGLIDWKATLGKIAGGKDNPWNTTRLGDRVSGNSMTRLGRQQYVVAMDGVRLD